MFSNVQYFTHYIQKENCISNVLNSKVLFWVIEGYVHTFGGVAGLINQTAFHNVLSQISVSSVFTLYFTGE